jgi:hypothetical protein
VKATRDLVLHWVQSAVEEMPADDADHEANVIRYRTHVAQEARRIAYVMGKDFDRAVWASLVEKAEEYHEVEQGADLLVKYGIPNTEEKRRIVLDGIQDELNWTADRLIETMKDY